LFSYVKLFLTTAIKILRVFIAEEKILLDKRVITTNWLENGVFRYFARKNNMCFVYRALYSTVGWLDF
jgi:hypothetical protein